MNAIPNNSGAKVTSLKANDSSLVSQSGATIEQSNNPKNSGAMIQALTTSNNSGFESTGDDKKKEEEEKRRAEEEAKRKEKDAAVQKSLPIFKGYTDFGDGFLSVWADAANLVTYKLIGRPLFETDMEAALEHTRQEHNKEYKARLDKLVKMENENIKELNLLREMVRFNGKSDVDDKTDKKVEVGEEARKPRINQDASNSLDGAPSTLATPNIKTLQALMGDGGSTYPGNGVYTPRVNVPGDNGPKKN